MKLIAKALAGLGLLTLAVSAHAEVQLRGGGATFPDPIYQTWIAEYQKAHPGVKIDYQANGSGAGIKSVTDKTFDFAGSDAPMNSAELNKAGGPDGIVEIPTVGGAVVLAYNLPGLNGELKLDGPTLAEIFLGDVKKWNDPKIVALNAGVSLPDLPITPVHRTDGSGTSFIYTNYLASQSQTFKDKVGTGKTVEWPVGTGGPGSAGVTQLVKQTKGGIGYVELAYALQNNLPFALMKNTSGQFVKADPESVSLAGESAAGRLQGHILVASIWNQPGEKVYPISAFTYMIVYKDLGYLKDPERAKALADFLRWATSDGEKFAGQLNYAPLSEGVKKKVQAALGGLTWEGKPVK
jgi:phosphate transport system substrate-binding protein